MKLIKRSLSACLAGVIGVSSAICVYADPISELEREIRGTNGSDILDGAGAIRGDIVHDLTDDGYLRFCHRSLHLSIPEVKALLGQGVQALQFLYLMIGKAHQLNDIGECFFFLLGGMLFDRLRIHNGIRIPDA